jgi:hypothetical protein
MGDKVSRDTATSIVCRVGTEHVAYYTTKTQTWMRAAKHWHFGCGALMQSMASLIG